jgi:P4 family phage/plasmid primase-like protien
MEASLLEPAGKRRDIPVAHSQADDSLKGENTTGALSDFVKYKDHPVAQYLLPIIPAGAKIRDISKVNEGHLGKIPGRYNSEEKAWSGYPKWTEQRATPTQLERWQAWQDETGPFAIGMHNVITVAFDLDIDVEKLVEAVQARIELAFGPTPVVRRREGSPRRVLIYRHKPHTAPLSKRIYKFKDGETVALLEMLARGEHVVIEGPHAKGSMHYWEDGSGLIEAWDKIPEIDIDQTSKFFVELRWFGEAVMGWETVRESHGAGTAAPGAATRIDDIISGHLAKDRGVLAQAIAAIDINDPRLAGYDEWCALFRAMKAACGGDQEFYQNHIWPWLSKNPNNNEMDMQAKWDSFKDSHIGVDHILQWAATFGATDALEAHGNATINDVFGPEDQRIADAAAANAMAGNGSANLAGSGGGPGAGGGGPLSPQDTHRELAIRFEQLFADQWRYNVSRKQWYNYGRRGDAVWRVDETVAGAIGDLANEVSQTVLATVNGPQGVQRARALNSGGTHFVVKRMLESRPALTMEDGEFDADPYLLNTPEAVFDLRTGEFMEHDPKLLLRQQTLVTPDFVRAKGCPNFLAFIRLIADGRPWVEPFLQRWFGYCLTGSVRHQHFLFIQGLPGTGKTQLLEIFRKLMGHYATMLGERFLVKGGEKRFDMGQIVGKRFGFGDETQKGSSWDETRASKVTSDKWLQAEPKGGKEFEFLNTIKLNIAGNHKPHFVSGQAGGLTRRMLLLEITHDPITKSGNAKNDFSDWLVATEGEAILMWAVEGAVLDYADKDNTFFNTLIAPMAEAALAYTEENSLYAEWIESEMEFGPDKSVELLEAYQRFKDYVQRTTKSPTPDRRVDFKAALKAAYPTLIIGERKSTRGGAGRALIKGLGFKTVFEE